MGLSARCFSRRGGFACVEDPGDGVGHPRPVLALFGQLAAAGPRQPVVLGLAVVLGRVPLGSIQPACFETMERGIERALIDLQHVSRDLLDALRDAPAVHRLERQRLQDEHVERALEEILFLTSHVRIVRSATCRMSRGAVSLLTIDKS